MAQHTTINRLDSEGTLGRVKVAEAVTIGDLLYNDEYMSKCFKVQVTDFAALGNVDLGQALLGASTGTIFNLENFNQRFLNAASRNPVVLTDNKEIIIVSPYGASVGIHLDRIKSDGSPLNSIDIDITGNISANAQVLKLSNGNIVVAYHLMVSSIGQINYIIYDSMMNVVKSLTTLSTVSSLYFHMIALSAGGFAIAYHDNTDNTKNKLVILDNSGNITVTAVDIWTRTGTNGAQFHRMVQLSNGNIAIAISSSNTISSIGLYYAVFTIAGVVVKAITNLDTVSIGAAPEIDTISTGFFAIARANSTNQKGYVLNNAGTLQGAEFSSATTAGANSNKTKIVNNGINFYLLWHRSSDSTIILTMLPTTGTNYVSSIVSTTSNNPYNLYIDAFYENNVIVYAFGPAGIQSSRFCVINLTTMQLVKATSNAFSSPPSTNNASQFLRLIPGGDRTFIAVTDFVTNSQLNLFVGKYGKTAISGIAQASGAIDSLIPVKATAPFQAINTIKGSPSKGFDHTANSLAGNKGTITLSAATLKGF